MHFTARHFHSGTWPREILGPFRPWRRHDTAHERVLEELRDCWELAVRAMLSEETVAALLNDC